MVFSPFRQRFLHGGKKWNEALLAPFASDTQPGLGSTVDIAERKRQGLSDTQTGAVKQREQSFIARSAKRVMGKGRYFGRCAASQVTGQGAGQAFTGFGRTQLA